MKIDPASLSSNCVQQDIIENLQTKLNLHEYGDDFDVANFYAALTKFAERIKSDYIKATGLPVSFIDGQIIKADQDWPKG